MLPRRSWTRLLLAAALAATAGVPVTAQDPDLREEILRSQRRLEEIRAERERLEREMGDVRNRVRDVAAELANVERRLSASRSALAEVQFLSQATSEQVEATTRELIHSKERLAESEAVLQRRLREIYKMGALQTVQVLLGASSFTDLLNRYRYLQRIAAFDRSLVERVSTLQDELARRNDDLQQRMAELGILRQDRITEVAQLASVETERQRTLREFRGREERAATRLDELEADESRLTALVDDLEQRRRELEATRARSGGPTLTAADAGALDWPLDGEIIYRFGRQQRPNGTVLRWNGIGLAAPTGTPVRAVRAGLVVLAGPFEGYGPTVVLSHGEGFYTLYLYLEEIGVVEGREVAAGQVVGTVGGADTPEGPHVEFQVRAPLAGNAPQAQDPLRWLRPREK